MGRRGADTLRTVLRRGEPSPGSRGPAPRGSRLVAFRVAVLAAVLCVIPLWLRAARQIRREVRQGWTAPLVELVSEERGPGFREAVDELRRTVPPDGSYLLLADPDGPGALTAISLRHAALPRRPVLLSRYGELAGEPAVPPGATVVVENDEEPPAVAAGAGLFGRFDPGSLGIEDTSLPAAVDEVVLEPTGKIRVKGWCQGFGGVACEVAAVLLNGRSVPVARMPRVPRPDVEAVVPSVGPCSRAGYRLTVPARVVSGDRFLVEVVFRTADGRWRAYPKQAVERPR